MTGFATEDDQVTRAAKAKRAQGRTADWYWAAASIENGPAGDRFIIENGQAALWPRVRAEIDRSERCMWMPVHAQNRGEHIEDILDIMLTVVPTNGVNMNRFVFEAAKIPVFARFLHGARCGLCNYVSNPLYPDHPLKPERYSDLNMRKLGQIVSSTLGIDDDWYE